MNGLDQELDAQLDTAFDRKLDELIEARRVMQFADDGVTNFKAVTPAAKEKLKGLLKYYAKKPHPFTACFAEDTPVDMPRDMEVHPDGVPISQVRAGDLVWCMDEKRRVFTLRRVKWTATTRRDAELVAIALDTGKVIRCTPDHRFMLRDGRWVEAGKLRVGDSLMPFYRDFTPRLRLSPDSLAFIDEHKVIAEAAHGMLDGRHVHHVDQRRANTSETNLRALTGSEHIAAHHDEFAEAVSLRDERWLCPSCEEMFTPTMRNQRHCEPCKLLRGYQKKIVGRYALCAVCDGEFTLRAPNQRYCSKLCRHRAKDRGIATPGKVGGVPNATAYNHKVVAVTQLMEREDVWDMEVEEHHNFVVQGVVVHNCVHDNTKRFGPERAKKVCAVLKDIIRGTTKWRGKNNPRDVGTPGVKADEFMDAETLDLIDRLHDLDLWELLGLVQLEDDSEIELKDYSFPVRMKMAGKGHALPDGSFPIADEQDVKNAVKAVNKAKDKKKAKKHVVTRAKALGHDKHVPAAWMAETVDVKLSYAIGVPDMPIPLTDKDTKFLQTILGHHQTRLTHATKYIVGDPHPDVAGFARDIVSESTRHIERTNRMLKTGRPY